MTQSDTKWTVSLVIADGYFNLPIVIAAGTYNQHAQW